MSEFKYDQVSHGTATGMNAMLTANRRLSQVHDDGLLPKPGGWRPETARTRLGSLPPVLDGPWREEVVEEVERDVSGSLR